jgi:hypothetical protein
MRTSRLLPIVCSVFLAFGNAQATTVIAPTFDELVSRAELILQGTVTNVQCQWVGEGGQRHITTQVTLRVEDAMKGAPGASYTITMLGGTVGDTTMAVSDSPKFRVGDRDILFVEHNGTQFVPLVGIMNGRFHLQRDQHTGADLVTTNGGVAVSDVARIGKDEQGQRMMDTGNANQLSSATALRSDAFKDAIRVKLAELSR